MSSPASLTPAVAPALAASPAAGVAIEQRQVSRSADATNRVPGAGLPAQVANTRQSVKAAAEQIETYLRHVNTNLEFRVDEDAGQVVVSVRERATGELIRQIPSEEALRLAERLAVRGTTALVDQET